MSVFHKELYSDMILRIKCGSYQGRRIKAKPLLFYSVIIMIEKDFVHDNCIYFDKVSEEFYKKISATYGEAITPFLNHFTICNLMVFGI